VAWINDASGYSPSSKSKLCRTVKVPAHADSLENGVAKRIMAAASALPHVDIICIRSFLALRA
jgi:hypothetical protein